MKSTYVLLTILRFHAVMFAKFSFGLMEEWKGPCAHLGH